MRVVLYPLPFLQGDSNNFLWRKGEGGNPNFSNNYNLMKQILNTCTWSKKKRRTCNYKNCSIGNDYTSIFQASLLNCALLVLSICLELCFCKLKKNVLLTKTDLIVFTVNCLLWVCLLLGFFLSVRTSELNCGYYSRNYFQA